MPRGVSTSVEFTRLILKPFLEGDLFDRHSTGDSRLCLSNTRNGGHATVRMYLYVTHKLKAVTVHRITSHPWTRKKHPS